MEIIILISLVVLLVLGALFVIPRSISKGKGKEAHSGGTGTASRSYSKKDVSTHNTRKDCWIIIKDKVYDVTSYVEEHPGGDAILNNAGADSTEGFFGT
ncbi:cytochrome B5-like protein isoform X2 [Lolium perenne]|uniref:cytochrome B5-like protein isoform X2 n=1 Tax=Lolium perenne TaxID=4522 RepID=UPI0021F5DFA8|nr:cytochrome B5-like protein isoform X2 [Lolium perenne]